MAMQFPSLKQHTMNLIFLLINNIKIILKSQAIFLQFIIY